MHIITVEHPKQEGLLVEAVTVHTAEQLREVRASDWHDGQLALLTYPSTVVGIINPDNPKLLGGQEVQVGDTILKGPAGDFEVIPAAEWFA